MPYFYGMKMFRSISFRSTFALFTGLVFLNMSFFLAEVTALKLDKDKRMVENIAKLIAGCSSEEESDAFGGSSDEDTSMKELDLLFSFQPATTMGFILLSDDIKPNEKPGLPRFGNYEIYSPPPEA